VSLVNFTTREITCKIVYYGPGRSGKTTNLHYIYGRVPDSRRGRMVSLATQTDRTLFFDFLPIDLGQISGFTTRFQLYTVPGQVYYNATRRLVLQGADGVVFVADSQAARMEANLESLRNLDLNLKEQGYDLRAVMVGSEGTLGVVAAVCVRLTPLAPVTHTMLFGLSIRMYVLR